MNGAETGREGAAMSERRQVGEHRLRPYKSRQKQGWICWRCRSIRPDPRDDQGEDEPV